MSRDFANEFGSAVSHAQNHHGSEDPSFFDSALSFLQERQSQYADPSRYDVDEDHAIRSHQAMYGGGGDGGGGGADDGVTHDSRSVGAGAAMQALKMFTSGGAADGGMDKNQLIGLAMAQASKMWDQKAGAGANMTGDKQSAINSAAENALMMYMKSGGGGFGGTGGPGGLMSLASKFLS